MTALERVLERRVARLFKNANNLAVRIPVDWVIDAEQVELTYDGKQIVVTPIPDKPTAAELLDSFAAEPVTDDWEDVPRTSMLRPVEL